MMKYGKGNYKMRKMQFHPGRLGIMTPKGETLADINIRESIKEDEKNRKEVAEKYKHYNSWNHCTSYIPFATID